MDAPGQLLTMNAAKSTHYRQWAALTAMWREAMAKRASELEVPAVAYRVGVEFWPVQFKYTLADPGAHMPCAKACIDGLRDAGVLSDDTGDQVAWVRMHAPTHGAGAGIVLELVPAT